MKKPHNPLNRNAITLTPGTAAAAPAGHGPNNLSGRPHSETTNPTHAALPPHAPDALAAPFARLSVPAAARRSLNRCNLPSEALASLAFQLAPRALRLDGVLPLHRTLFEHADRLAAAERAAWFERYMRAHFLLDDAAAQGWQPAARTDRRRLDYRKLLRGWLFDSHGREAAVWKGWVESRFGLLTSFHRETLDRPAARRRFEHELAAGLYATAALETQLDLLYAWAQHELRHRQPGARHLRLYRGCTGGAECTPLQRLDDGRVLVALNNLSSFSTSRERADEFGDTVLCCDVPLPKIAAFSGLLPDLLQGEDECLVIGGVVAVRYLGGHSPDTTSNATPR